MRCRFASLTDGPKMILLIAFWGRTRNSIRPIICPFVGSSVCQSVCRSIPNAQVKVWGSVHFDVICRVQWGVGVWLGLVLPCPTIRNDMVALGYLLSSFSIACYVTLHLT